MACRIQQKSPIQLKVTFPENGCRSDLTVYYHPADGQQRSIFGCDWVEREQAYDCNNLESGVSWYRSDSRHATITLPQNIDHNSGYFRYQFSCHEHPQGNMCSLVPSYQETADYTMPVEAVSSTTAAMRTEYTAQQDLNQFGYQVFVNLVAGLTTTVIIILVLVLAFVITTIYLCKKNKDLKEVIRAKDIEGQHALDAESKRTVESGTKLKPKPGKFYKLEPNFSNQSETESELPRMPESKAENKLSSSLPGSRCTGFKNRKRKLTNKKNKGREESETGAEGVPFFTQGEEDATGCIQFQSPHPSLTQVRNGMAKEVEDTDADTNTVTDTDKDSDTDTGTD